MHLSVKQSDSVDLLHHGGEGDALLSEPLGQAGVGEGVARGVDTARVGHLVHLAEDGEAGLHEALAGRPVPDVAAADGGDDAPAGLGLGVLLPGRGPALPHHRHHEVGVLRLLPRHALLAHTAEREEPGIVLWNIITIVILKTSAANRLIGDVVQSRGRPLLGPSPG